jgi:hypothetical protein
VIVCVVVVVVFYLKESVQVFFIIYQAEEKSTFLKYNSSVFCGGSGSTQVNRDLTSVKNKLISYGNLCTAGVKKDTDYGEKCGK